MATSGSSRFAPGCAGTTVRVTRAAVNTNAEITTAPPAEVEAPRWKPLRTFEEECRPPRARWRGRAATRRDRGRRAAPDREESISGRSRREEESLPRELRGCAA